MLPLTKSDFQLKKKSGPRDRRTELIDKVSKLVERPYKQMLGLLKDIKDDWIEQWLAYCSDAKNPAITFWWLLKESKVDKTSRQK